MPGFGQIAFMFAREDITENMNLTMADIGKQTLPKTLCITRFSNRII